MAAYTIAPHTKRKLTDLTKLFPLEWDAKKVKKETPEEREKRLAQFAKWDKQMKQKQGNGG